MAVSRRHTSWAVQRQREILQEQRALERAQRAQLAAARAAERERLRADRERQKEYLASRTEEAAEQSEQVENFAATLDHLLAEGLARDSYLDFEDLRQPASIPKFEPGALAMSSAPPDPAAFQPPPLRGLKRFLPGAESKFQQTVAAGQAAFESTHAAWENSEQERQKAYAQAKKAHDEAVEAAQAAARAQHSEVDSLRSAFEQDDPSAIAQYFSLILDSSEYPEGFPRKRKLAFAPDSRQLVVEVQLPTLDVVPTEKSFRYVRAKDEIEGTPRPLSQRRTLYGRVVAQVALRTLYEIFTADRTAKCDTVVINGFVEAINPATGQPVSPYLVTVRTTRDVFQERDLAQVDPLACLKGLNAGVSRSPAELEPVRPVVDFNMVDPRFIEETDVLSGLDQRPNLMELSPSEFENLITNLFEKMGLETRLTQASRDGGVDCVAWDQRPIFGGKVVIQAKRYKHTVGVSAVRDLFGTVQNEGASKGILVTTSGYGKASFEFAEGKPLELLDGANLLYLLSEHAGIEAKIEVPEAWVDPVPDSAV